MKDALARKRIAAYAKGDMNIEAELLNKLGLM